MSKDTLLSVQEVKERIDGRLDTYLLRREKDAHKIDPVFAQLIADVRQFIGRGGKRMRPYLAYLSYVGMGGTQIDDFFDVSISLELLHNFLLVHDDIIDRDFQRYGGLNIAGTYHRQFGEWMNKEDAMHLSGAVALLAGDVDAVMCSDVVLESAFPDDTKITLLREINRVIFAEGGGEYLDMMTPHQNVSEEYLEKIYEYKSGIYSIEMPLRFGALLNKNSTTFDNFSRPIGIAFQLVDDMLGIFGDEKKTGKPILSDLHEGKKTILMVYALNQASPEQKNTLENALGNTQTTLKDLEVIRKIIVQTGAYQYVKDKAQYNLDSSLKSLQTIKMTDSSKAALSQLAKFIIARNY